MDANSGNVSPLYLFFTTPVCWSRQQDTASHVCVPLPLKAKQGSTLETDESIPFKLVKNKSCMCTVYHGPLQSTASFVVPMFRATTEKSLKEKCPISDKDRKYIVRTMATVLMSFNPQPRLGDCAVAAKALIAKYPFLGDTTGKPHVSRMCMHNQVYT